MAVVDEVADAARSGNTVMLTAREKDGSVETREVEPYSLRDKGTGKYLYAWSLRDQGIRMWRVDNLLAAVVTGNIFEPRFPVEF